MTRHLLDEEILEDCTLTLVNCIGNVSVRASVFVLNWRHCRWWSRKTALKILLCLFKK